MPGDLDQPWYRLLAAAWREARPSYAYLGGGAMGVLTALLALRGGWLWGLVGVALFVYKWPALPERLPHGGERAEDSEHEG